MLLFRYYSQDRDLFFYVFAISVSPSSLMLKLNLFLSLLTRLLNSSSVNFSTKLSMIQV